MADNLVPVEKFQLILNFVSSWICLLPMLCGIIWFVSLSGESRKIWLLVILACVPQTLHIISEKNTGLLPLAYNLYTPAEFYLIYSVFKSHVHNKTSKLWLKASLVVYSAACLYFLLFFSVSRAFIPVWAAINNIFYTSWLLTIFYEQYASDNHYTLTFKDPVLWFIMGLLFYAPCTAMIFSAWHYMENSNQHVMKIIHGVFNINMYICFAAGLWKDRSFKLYTTQ